MECKHLLMLTSLKKLVVESSDGLVGSLGGGDDVQWQHPVEHLVVDGLCGASVKKLTELLSHLPRLSELCITKCENITQLAVGMDMQQTTSTAAPEVEKEEEGLLLFPADLSGSLRVLYISECPELFPSPSCCIFPSSLLDLNLKGVEGLCPVWVHRIRLRIKLAMEYQINDFNGISFWMFGCAWYSPVESRLQWISKSYLDVHCVELKEARRNCPSGGTRGEGRAPRSPTAAVRPPFAAVRPPPAAILGLGFSHGGEGAARGKG
ncbi:hypothetical protein ACQ4PT_031522 [Festuca glaucescens]